jgi:hypothetical protein
MLIGVISISGCRSVHKMFMHVNIMQNMNLLQILKAQTKKRKFFSLQNIVIMFCSLPYDLHKANTGICVTHWHDHGSEFSCWIKFPCIVSPSCNPKEGNQTSISGLQNGQACPQSWWHIKYKKNHFVCPGLNLNKPQNNKLHRKQGVLAISPKKNGLIIPCTYTEICTAFFCP